MMIQKSVLSFDRANLASQEAIYLPSPGRKTGIDFKLDISLFSEGDKDDTTQHTLPQKSLAPPK